MATWKGLTTCLLAIENWIFTGGSRLVARNFRQRRLATGAVKNDIWRSRTVCGLRLLRVTTLLAFMYTTIKRAVTSLRATEAAGPFLIRAIFVDDPAFLLVIFGLAQHFSLQFATIATGLNADFTSSTKTLVTW
jgi:hypothetical protein